MNTEKLADLIAVGTREEDILEIMGCTQVELAEHINKPETQTAVQSAKDERYQTFNDINKGWDLAEQLGLHAVLQTLEHNPDPAFALAVASTANKMRRRDVGSGQVQPIQAQQNNVVIVRLNQDFTKELMEGRNGTNGKHNGNGGNGHTFDAEASHVSSQGLPKDVNTLELREAEKILLPVETQEAKQTIDELLGLDNVTMDARF